MLVYGASSNPNTNGTVAGVGNDITYSWIDTPFTGYIEFTIDTSFDLVFTSFVSPLSSISDVSAYTLDRLVAGDPPLRLTNDTNFANSAATPVTGNGNLFAIPGATNALASEPGDTLLSSLVAGSYRLGVYDSATPSAATAVFSIVSVPEPSTVVLWTLLSSIGLVTLGRRRESIED